MDVTTFGEKLRELRARSGLTLRQLADKSHHSRSKLHNWEHDRPPPPTEREATELDRILDGDGTLIATMQIPGVNGAADRLAYVRDRPRAVDLSTVKALTGALANLRRLEDAVGSERLLIITAEPHRLVEELADEAVGDLRPLVVDLAGQWAQFVGWLRAAAGKPGPAKDWYLRAAGYAEEVEETSTLPTGRELIATALSMRGHLAWSARRPGPTVGLSAAAAAKSQSPGIQAMAMQQEARGHALLRDADAADKLLDDAEKLMAKAHERPDKEPPWIYFYSPGYLQMQRGLVASLLDRREDAIEWLTAGLKAAGPEVAGAEFGARYKLALAEAHVAGGNPDEARRYLEQARATAVVTGSAELAGDVARVEALLSD